MPFPSRFWADLTTRDFAGLDAATTVAVLPVAAIEQHGPHLPLSVDQSIVDGVIAQALPRLPAEAPVLVLPTQAVGYSPEHTAFAGTLTLPVETLVQVWVALGECVARAGVKKLLLFNAHGGQTTHEERRGDAPQTDEAEARGKCQSPAFCQRGIAIHVGAGPAARDRAARARG